MAEYKRRVNNSYSIKKMLNEIQIIKKPKYNSGKKSEKTNSQYHS